MSLRIVLNPADEPLRPFVQNLEHAFEHEGTVIYEGRNTLKRFETAYGSVVVKSFKRPNFINKIAYGFFRPSKARRSYEHSLQLLERGIGTPRPIACVERFRFGLLFESYYVCEAVDDVFEIRAVFADAQFEAREAIFKAFAEFSRSVHDRGVFHVDYSAGNILIRQTGDGYDFSLVDVNRMRFTEFDDELRMRALARIGAGERDADAVVRYYAQCCGLDEAWCLRTFHRYRDAHLRRNARKRKLKSLKR